MGTIRSLLKAVPGVHTGYSYVRNKVEEHKLSKSSNSEIFTEYFRNNTWQGKESVSGTGSDRQQTRTLVAELKKLLQDLQISSIVDVPCGDHFWVNEVVDSKTDYFGGDIVEELVKVNASKYGGKNKRFSVVDILNCGLPEADMLICRDCLVHFSMSDIELSLENIGRSRYRYFASTTYIDCAQNAEILTGQWRKLNLQRKPFDFPDPVICLLERSTEHDGKDSDKALAVWRFDDLFDASLMQR